MLSSCGNKSALFIPEEQEKTNQNKFNQQKSTDESKKDIKDIDSK